jgi:hypothetical protein
VYLVRVIKSQFSWGILLTAIGVIAFLSLTVLSRIASDSNFYKGPHKYRKKLDDITPTVIPIKTIGSIGKGLAYGGGEVQGIAYTMTLPPKHAGLATSSSPELRKLAQYEQVADGAIATGMMFFTDTPITNQQALNNAAYVIGELKEYAKFGIVPIVIMEPTTDNGALDYGAYEAGSYDSALDTFYNSIRSAGITDQQMGVWVPFPEDNAPLWGNTDPATFAANVTRTVQIQKKYFPGSLASILLNGNTYQASDTDWANGVYSSLVPYVAPIPKGLIDSFGLQGFPWDPPNNGGGKSISDASVFLPSNLAAEAAKTLGIQKIWFNTGTYGSKYTSNKSQRITVSALKRQQTLNSVIGQVKKLQGAGYNTTINLFSADKSSLEEATDWSYWSNPTNTDSNKDVFLNFISQLRQSGVGFWLFDSYQP